jgi:glycosyltransferase involved in cell wall biosynthesis
VELNAALIGPSKKPARIYHGGMSFAVCTNRPENLSNASSVARALGPDDELFVVVDLSADAVPARIRDGLRLAGVRLLDNHTNRGLSYSRNRALAECANHTLVYVDDDVTLIPETVEGIRRGRAEGSGIVGVLLVPRFSTSRRRWWLTGGQYHYLGVHHDSHRAKTWGACMAVDARLANEHGIRFREELGRRGAALQSGDDTTFLAELRQVGARELVLTGVSAVHHIDADRERLSYLLRRAWWQGRSERRRRNLGRALFKEWRRNVGAGPARASLVRRYPLAVLFVGAVVVGGVTELVYGLLAGRSAR